MKEYNEYIIHQASKLNKHHEEIIRVDSKYEETVYNRYKALFEFTHKSIICLGARLGGEVRAFKRLDALSIGIDINPGKENPHVLYGDFHNVKFPAETFDFVFSNCIDHVYDIGKFLSECKRLIKKSGKVLLEIAIQKAGEYETIDTSDITSLTEEIDKIFNIRKIININNGWKGKLFILTVKY